MLSWDPTSTRFDDADHRNQEIEAANSGGRAITRTISRERVSRMLNVEGKIVAMYAPSGLGSDCLDAECQSSVSNTLGILQSKLLHFKDLEKRIVTVCRRIEVRIKNLEMFVYFLGYCLIIEAVD